MGTRYSFGFAIREWFHGYTRLPGNMLASSSELSNYISDQSFEVAREHSWPTYIAIGCDTRVCTSACLTRCLPRLHEHHINIPTPWYILTV
jgi:hypothetical protein